MKEILISIKPKWCEKICNKVSMIPSGYEKTVEVRKKKPSTPTPFTVLIYCTYGQPFIHNGNRLNGKVIGEFVCDYVVPTRVYRDRVTVEMLNLFETSCVCVEDLREYALADSFLSAALVYGWHISDLKIYDQPKELAEFGVKRPPQSYMYIEK